MDKVDPYVAMIGAEFIRHGRQQKARMIVADPKFPGMEAAGSDGFELLEEWYSLKDFAPDLHVLLVQDTKGMVGPDYDRPPYPATWARRYGRGRVFYSSMGHREDVWESARFQTILRGGLRFAFGDAPRNIDLSPNLVRVAPGYATIPPRSASPSSGARPPSPAPAVPAAP
jgi:type 1 glutamine amidotransferase